MSFTPSALPASSEYQDFAEPIPELENGRTYWRYRSGGYNPADGTYGRCGTREEAETILRKALPLVTWGNDPWEDFSTSDHIPLVSFNEAENDQLCRTNGGLDTTTDKTPPP